MRLFLIFSGAFIHAIIFFFCYHICYIQSGGVHVGAFIIINEVFHLPFGLIYWTWIGDRKLEGK